MSLKIKRQRRCRRHERTMLCLALPPQLRHPSMTGHLDHDGQTKVQAVGSAPTLSPLRELQNLLLAHTRPQCDMPACDMPACGPSPAGSALQLTTLIGPRPAPRHAAFPSEPGRPQGRGLSMGGRTLPSTWASPSGLQVYIAHRPPPLFPSFLSLPSPARHQQADQFGRFSSPPPFSSSFLSRGLASLNIKKSKNPKLALSLSPRFQVTG